MVDAESTRRRDGLRRLRISISDAITTYFIFKVTVHVRRSMCLMLYTINARKKPPPASDTILTIDKYS
jgi:hypothetical protein